MRAVALVALASVVAAGAFAAALERFEERAQLIGPAWREDVCLAAAGTIETAHGVMLPIDLR